MAKQTINLGTGELTGDGESIRSAFDKINDNFDELYIRDLNTDAQTLTLVGDTLSISGGNSVTITHPTIPTALSDLTSDLDNLNAGENIPDLLTAYTDQSAVVDALLNVGDWGGGLVAPSDYTYYDLVVQRRAVNPLIPQELEDEALAQLNAYNAWQAEIAADKATITVGDYAWNFKGDGVLSFPDGTTQTTAWTGITDLTGSVFADDSTLLVDGVNGTIPAANLTGTIPPSVSGRNIITHYGHLDGSTIDSGSGNFSASLLGSDLQITFDTNMSDTFYVVNVSIDNGSDNSFCQIFDKTTSGFKIRVQRLQFVSQNTFPATTQSAGNYEFSFMVIGT